MPLPAPGDLIIAFYGFRARDDPIELAKTILICAAASTTGTLLPYAIARRWGPPLAHRLAGWMDVDQRRIDEWTGRIQRHGFRAVVIGRLIPGARVAMSLVAGLSGVKVRQFSAGVFVAGTIYWTVWVMLGALLGPTIEDLIAPTYFAYIVLVLPVVFVGYVIFRVVKHRRHQR